MKKVLLILNDSVERRGGALYLLEWIRYATPHLYSFDVCFLGELIDESFAREFLNLGVTLYCCDDMKSGRFRKTVSYIKDLLGIIKKSKYDIVHINAGSPWFSAITLSLAWARGVKRRFAHAHTSFPQESCFKKAYYLLPRMVNRRLSDQYIGVSKAAVMTMFGEKAFHKESRVLIICPRIDIEKFAFRQDERTAYRKRLRLEDDFVVGHVGSFSTEKNHEFLIEVFQKVAEKRENVKLLLVGSGEDEAKIKTLARENGLQDQVIFAGSTNRVQDYLCVMDCFVLPSLREGFSLVLLEAQASGLPCIASDVIPPEVGLTDLVRFYPLSAGSEKWAQHVLETELAPADQRQESWKRVVAAGYDTSAFPKIISELYDENPVINRGGG